VHNLASFEFPLLYQFRGAQGAACMKTERFIDKTVTLLKLQQKQSQFLSFHLQFAQNAHNLKKKCFNRWIKEDL
jgi:hypothetical protein